MCVKKWRILVGLFVVFVIMVVEKTNLENVAYGIEVSETEYCDFEASSVINPNEPSLRSRSIGNRDVSINNLVVKTRDTTSAAFSFPDSEYRIWYMNGNKAIIVHEGVTNKNGEIKGITLNNIPSGVTTLSVRMIMGKRSRGYIQNQNNKTYGVVYALKIPTNSIIDINANYTFGSTDEQRFYCLQYTRMNYYFYDAMKEIKDIVDLANQAFPESAKFQPSDPINIIFENGYRTNKGSAYYGSGRLGKSEPEIVIADEAITEAKPEIFRESIMKHSILHEWLHYNFGKYAEHRTGTYKGHYGYNKEFYISYKEGICLLFGDFYGFDYQYPNTGYEGINQRSIKARGRSTNSTVSLVFGDLVDTETTKFSDENVSVGKKHAESDREVRRLNLGIIYTLAIETKPQTMAQLLTAYQKNYVSSAEEKKEFDQLLKVNTLSNQRNFTLKPDPAYPDLPNEYSVPLTEADIIYGETGIVQQRLVLETYFEPNDAATDVHECEISEEER